MDLYLYDDCRYYTIYSGVCIICELPYNYKKLNELRNNSRGLD